MAKKDIEIIKNPTSYYVSKSKVFDDCLKEIEIPKEELDKIKSEATKSLIKDKLLGLFKIGEVIKTVFDWNNNVDDEIKKAKQNVLLGHYFEITKSNQDSLNKLKSFLTNPSGNTIFNKILGILNNSPPDVDLLKSLAIALTKITNTGDFEKLFEKHKYALSLIEKLSAQSLVILSDSKNWPKFEVGGYIANGTKLTSDWFLGFAKTYCQKIGIGDISKQNRIFFSVKELAIQGYIEAHILNKETKEIQVKITPIGEEVLDYVGI